MVKLTSITLGLAAIITGAQAGFKKPCYAPYDTCGWSLVNSEFGYDHSILQDATAAAGQDATNGSVVYNAIYNCHADGVIIWNHGCDHGFDGAVFAPNANCRA